MSFALIILQVFGWIFTKNADFWNRFFCWNFEIAAVQKYANLVELEKCGQTHIFLQNFVLIQPRPSPPKKCKILLTLVPNRSWRWAAGSGWARPRRRRRPAAHPAGVRQPQPPASWSPWRPNFVGPGSEPRQTASIISWCKIMFCFAKFVQTFWMIAEFWNMTTNT